MSTTESYTDVLCMVNLATASPEHSSFIYYIIFIFDIIIALELIFSTISVDFTDFYFINALCVAVDFKCRLPHICFSISHRGPSTIISYSIVLYSARHLLIFLAEIIWDEWTCKNKKSIKNLANQIRNFSMISPQGWNQCDDVKWT